MCACVCVYVCVWVAMNIAVPAQSLFTGTHCVLVKSHQCPGDVPASISVYDLKSPPVLMLLATLVLVQTLYSNLFFY